MNITTEEFYQAVFQSVSSKYDEEQKKLSDIGAIHLTEGAIRYAAGELVEKILQSIFDAMNKFLPFPIISKVGSSDYLTKKIEYNNNIYTNDHIQVDRHVWYQGKRIAFIENKTYLDTCYFDRALADFKKIIQALAQEKVDPTRCAYIVFAGQIAGRENTFLNYEAEFWDETKIVPKRYFFLKGIRNSSKPLYKIKHPLNYDGIRAFVNMILTLL